MAGGARPNDLAELRTDAIVGQLRRWWWAKAPLIPGFSVANAEKSASALFGATGDYDDRKRDNDNEKRGGQGALLVNMANCAITTQKKELAFISDRHINELFGPLWSSRKQALWNNDETKRHFELEFALRPSRPKFPDGDELVSQMRDSLQLWGLLGGIGAGQRRGFGSVQLLELDLDGGKRKSEPGSINDYTENLKVGLGLQLGAKFPTARTGQQFVAFVNRVLDANDAGSSALNAGIYISETPYNTGVEALLAIAVAAKNLTTGQQQIVDIFSEGKKRAPSPYHFHIVRLGKQYYVAASMLPCGSTTYGCDLVNRMQKLFDALRMKVIIP